MEGQTNDISFYDFKLLCKEVYSYSIKIWIRILILGVLGGLLGLILFFVSPHKYESVTTFASEESNNMLGNLSTIASLAGVNVGKGSSIFSADGLIKLATSRRIIEQSLLTPMVDSLGNNLLIVEHYININKLRQKWQGKKFEKVHFDLNKTRANFSKPENEVLRNIYEKLREELNVYRPDKLLNIVVISIESKDEAFAYNFVNAIKGQVSLFYSQTKSNELAENIKALQIKADSIWGIIYTSMYKKANYADQNQDLAKQILSVASQRNQIEIQTMTVAYGEIMKNLETAKAMHLRENSLLKVIDDPILPLKDNKKPLYIFICFGGFIFGFGTFLYILGRSIRKLYFI